MASKKCPKCGEDNPAEAVMCWACYTPLTGGAPVGVKGPASPGGKAGGVVTPEDEGGKKQLDPKALGLGALLLVGIGAAVFMNMGALGGAPSDEGGGTDPTPSPGGGGGGGGPSAPPPPSAPPGAPPGAPGAAPAVELPYETMIGPNPRYATGTLGILSTNKTISATQARGLAKFARDQFARNGNWKNMQIAVFTDPNAARAFATYQARRKSERLTPQDYAALASQGVWSGAPAFYEATGKSERLFSPSQNPSAWWGMR